MIVCFIIPVPDGSLNGLSFSTLFPREESRGNEPHAKWAYGRTNLCGMCALSPPRRNYWRGCTVLHVKHIGFLPYDKSTLPAICKCQILNDLLGDVTCSIKDFGQFGVRKKSLKVGTCCRSFTSHLYTINDPDVVYMKCFVMNAVCILIWPEVYVKILKNWSHWLFWPNYYSVISWYESNDHKYYRHCTYKCLLKPTTMLPQELSLTWVNEWVPQHWHKYRHLFKFLHIRGWFRKSRWARSGRSGWKSTRGVGGRHPWISSSRCVQADSRCVHSCVRSCVC